MRARRGGVPAALDAPTLVRDGFVADADLFLLQAAPGLRFGYRRGAGVRWSAKRCYDAAAVATFREGSVWGAVAWANALVPLHASAIVHNGLVHAFAGDSGAGKSTLVAALAMRGWTFFADDVVTVDTRDDGVPVALPGHKALKLWGDALLLTGFPGGARVWPGIDKFYVDVGGRDQARPLPLASFTLIEDGSEPESAPVDGAGRFMALHRHCYRHDLRLAAPSETFARIAELATAVPVYRLQRPRDRDAFHRGVTAVEAHLQALAA